MSKSKILTLSLLLFFGLLGCGKISTETGVSLSNSSTAATSQPVETTSETKTEQVVNSISGLLTYYFPGLNNSGQTQSVDQPPASFQNKGGFSSQTISFDDAYQYWNYSITTKNIGSLVQVIEGKYRFKNKSTGQWFTKLMRDFTAQDWVNVDHCERLENSRGFYLGNTNPVYTTQYHEKIVYNPTNYVITPYPGYTSTMTYIGVNQQTWGTNILNIADFTITYDKSADNNASAYIKINAPNNFYSEVNILTNNNSFTGTSNIYYQNNSNLVVAVLIPGSTRTVESHYYIGKQLLYSSLAMLYNDIEDNATAEIQDNGSYADVVTLDGSTSLCKLGSRLTNHTITSKPGLASYPKLTARMTVKNVDGFTLGNVDVSATGIRIINCTNVKIHGRTLGSITDQTFYN